MKVKEVMSRELRGVRADATLRDAARQMQALDVGSLPVASSEGNRIVGLVTDRDIVVRAVANDEKTPETPVEDVMSRPLVCCHTEDEVEDAAITMKSKQIRRLLVLDEQNRPVGMLSLGDVASSDIAPSEITSLVRDLSTPEGA